MRASRAAFITGVAGFIGSHVAKALLARGWSVLGIDTEQAALSLVPLRLTSLQEEEKFHYIKMDVCDQEALTAVLAEHKNIDVVLHFAARAGVRQSRINPHAYIKDNIEGQVSLLEACRILPHLRHILYASSSSVYGPSTPLPFSEAARVEGQASFYATTKRMNELTAHTYSHLYGFTQTALRFFTVYGPLGRPDMACYKFARAIRDGTPLTLWEEVGLARDFTYIDDVVEAILLLMEAPLEEGTNRTFNIGYGKPRYVVDLVRGLERALEQDALIHKAPKPVEDVLTTWADTALLRQQTAWIPRISLEEGVERFGRWFTQNSPF